MTNEQVRKYLHNNKHLLKVYTIAKLAGVTTNEMTYFLMGKDVSQKQLNKIIDQIQLLQCEK